MKNKIILVIALFTCLFVLSSCNYNKNTPTVDEHQHVFDQQVLEETYLIAPATCQRKAVYAYSCSCGEKGGKTFEYGELAIHAWDEGTLVSGPTLDEESGKYYSKYSYVCSVCNASKTSNVEVEAPTPVHKCDFTGTWKTDATHHWHECSCGETDTKVAHSGGTATTTELAKCEVCGTSYGELKQEEHTHDFTGEYKSDSTHHWHECSCGETDTKVAHSGGTATTTELAKCEVCGTSYGELKQEEHTHDFTGEYKSDATHHWHECSCGETDTKVAHSGGVATTTEKAICEVCGTSYGELKQPETKTIGEQIQDEYDSLKAGTTTTHTKWSFQATVVDMTATKYSDTHGNYNLRFVANVDDVLIGVFDGQVNNSFPTNIDGLEVGSVVTITGVIAENYTLTSGTYKVNIEFSKPEVSWTTNPSTSKYTVTYNANGHGTAPSALINVTALPSSLPTLSATGYTFGGWYLDASCTQAATAGATINANTTLYAKWTVNSSSEPEIPTTSAIQAILNEAASLGAGEKLSGSRTATGTVKSIEEAYTTEYKTISFILTDGVAEILVHRAKGDIAATLQVGDSVLVTGEIINYKGNTIEFQYPTISEVVTPDEPVVDALKDVKFESIEEYYVKNKTYSISATNIPAGLRVEYEGNNVTGYGKHKVVAKFYDAEDNLVGSLTAYINVVYQVEFPEI